MLADTYSVSSLGDALVWNRVSEQNGASKYQLQGTTLAEPTFLEIRHTTFSRNGVVFDQHNMKVTRTILDSNTNKDIVSTGNLTIAVPRHGSVDFDDSMVPLLGAARILFDIASGEISAISTAGEKWGSSHY